MRESGTREAESAEERTAPASSACSSFRSPLSSPETVRVLPLGRVPYDAAWAAQKRLQAGMVEAKRRGEAPPHLLLLVEHDPVITLGQSGNRKHVLLSDEALAARGIAFRHIDRGGDVTYHGPGQLVGYPILDLERFRPDLHLYLRTLEDVIIATCADYGIEAGRYVNAKGKPETGVWVGPPGQERKICAFGIRCTRWVTLHGWAFNLNTDLSAFNAIVPCGIAERGVTSLARELSHPVDEGEVTSRLLVHFAEAFGARLELVPETEARLKAGLDAAEATPGA